MEEQHGWWQHSLIHASSVGPITPRDGTGRRRHSHRDKDEQPRLVVERGGYPCTVGSHFMSDVWSSRTRSVRSRTDGSNRPRTASYVRTGRHEVDLAWSKSQDYTLKDLLFPVQQSGAED
jgi:hypothetical protein